MSVLHCTMERGISVSLSIGGFGIDDECVYTIVALLVVAELVLFRTGLAVHVCRHDRRPRRSRWEKGTKKVAFVPTAHSLYSVWRYLTGGWCHNVLVISGAWRCRPDRGRAGNSVPICIPVGRMRGIFKISLRQGPLFDLVKSYLAGSNACDNFHQF